MLPQIHQGVMNSWHILKRFLTEEEIVVYSNGWNPLSSKPQVKKDQGVPCQEEGGNQGRSPSSFYQQAPSQPTSPRRAAEQEKESEKNIFPKLQDSKNPNRFHRQCLQHGQKFDGIQRQGGAKNVTNLFPKEITLSPDVVNALTELKDSILPLQNIKSTLLSLQEINNSLSSLKKEIDNIKFMVENKKP
ncbi:hypothetical protein O181_045882 [Austropuccinia psidii MF-1]|uniref:Uncharacterized protein n=1 Tax=Austropuccinia psidii MF-1 TaxID=1389203 RepID=A0A9Q3DQ75_9BASI|nr:hypothetical protein [Austropuccinia psidii MF-1]